MEISRQSEAFAYRVAEQAQLEWDRSFATGDWELIARPPTGGIKVVQTEDRHPDTLQSYARRIHVLQ